MVREGLDGDERVFELVRQLVDDQIERTAARARCGPARRAAALPARRTADERRRRADRRRRSRRRDRAPPCAPAPLRARRDCRTRGSWPAARARARSAPTGARPSSTASSAASIWARAGMSSRRSRSGRQAHRQHGHPIVQIGCERPSSSVDAELGRRRGDQPHAGAVGHAHQPGRLEGAEQRLLGRRTELLDAVDEQRAAAAAPVWPGRRRRNGAPAAAGTDRCRARRGWRAPRRACRCPLRRPDAAAARCLSACADGAGRLAGDVGRLQAWAERQSRR